MNGVGKSLAFMASIINTQDAEIVQPYSDAGATWWIEYEASRETFDEYRDRIRRGPPRIS